MRLPAFRVQPSPGESAALPVLRSAVLAVAPDLGSADASSSLVSGVAEPAARSPAFRGAALPGLGQPPGLAGLRRLADRGRHRAGQRRRTGSRAGARAGSRAGARPLAQLPVLCLACSFTPGSGSATGAAALARVLAGDPLAGTVVLALGAGAELDAEACAALHMLADELDAAGVALRLAVTCHQHHQQLASTGLTSRLGPGAIYPTPRAAVLAVHASRPGPGLVTPEIREALLVPPEQLPPS